MAKPIYFFGKKDRYFELSNFYPRRFEVSGESWPTVEHYFQAQKFEDVEYRERIKSCGSPQQAKVLGQSRNLPIKNNWDEIKEDIMLEALRNKFKDPELSKVLRKTGQRELIEDSPYDSYWGIGPRKKGKNRLGKLLMQVRDEMREARE